VLARILATDTTPQSATQTARHLQDTAGSLTTLHPIRATLRADTDARTDGSWMRDPGDPVEVAISELDDLIRSRVDALRAEAVRARSLVQQTRGRGTVGAAPGQWHDPHGSPAPGSASEGLAPSAQ